MKIISRLFLVLTISLTASCVSFTPRLPPGSSLDPTKGYLYGKFDQVDYITIGRLLIAIGISEVNTHENYTISFEENRQTAVISVPPGNYSISEIVFAVGNEVLEKRNIKDKGIFKDFEVHAGHAYYLGDWTAVTNAYEEYGFIKRTWKISDFQDNYSKTTKDFLNTYNVTPNTQTFNVIAE